MGKVIKLKGEPLDLNAPPADDVANDAPGDDAIARSPADAGNAQRFAAQHQGKLLYCSAFGWLVWDGRRWAPDSKDEVMRFALQTAESLKQEIPLAIGDEGKKKALAFYVASHKRERLRAMIDIARHMLAAGIETFDRNESLLNCDNGTIDLRTGEIKKPDPLDLITKLADVEYNPRAKAPRFEKFLLEIFKGDRELIRYMQRAMGYSLTGRQDEECLFILQGGGHNGKTTLIQAFIAMLGKDYADVARSELLMHRRFDDTRIDNAGLRGKRFISISETNAGQRLNEEVVKTITGKEPLKGKLLYKDQFTFLPTHHIWLYSNYRPKVRGRDDGIWRRIRLIPFTEQFDGDACDKTLPDKLSAERAGILAWAVAGAVAWWNGGKNPSFGDSKVITNATQAYRDTEDLLKQYLDDRVAAKKDANISATLLYKNYKEWAEERSYFPWPMNTLGEYLSDAGFESKRTKNGAVRLGLRLKTDEEIKANDAEVDASGGSKRKFAR